MRFWITKNGRLTVREQLVRQVILGILSDDLPAGQKLPSIRALARRYHVHSNTVSTAYHELLEQGWLELRRGSGVYVRSRGTPGADSYPLDELLHGLLRAARNQGYEPAQVLDRLMHLVEPRVCRRVCVAEGDPGMREILLAEMRDQLTVPVESVDVAHIADQEDCLVVALPSRAPAVRKHLPKGLPFLTLRLRSVRGSLERETKPAANAVVSIVSRSPEFRQWASVMLTAVGLEPECLCEVDTALEGWQERVRAGTLSITDVVASAHLPRDCDKRVFQVIADATIAELKQFCGV